MMTTKNSQHKITRDKLNIEVQEAKVDRDKWNKKLNSCIVKLADKKRQNVPDQIQSKSQLKKQLSSLEYQQTTSVLSLPQEREIVHKISAVYSEIKKLTDLIEQDSEISLLINKTKEAKQYAEYYHNLVKELAEKSQQEHDAIQDYTRGKVVGE